MTKIEVTTIVEALDNSKGTKKSEVKKELREALRDENITEKELNRALKANSALIRETAIENQAEVNLSNPVQIDKKLYAKLEQANFMNPDGELDKKAVQDVLVKSAGVDKYFDYSHKNSEAKSAAMELSQNGVEFKSKDAKKLAKALLSKESVEAAYTPLKTFWKGLVGGGAGAAIGSTLGINVMSTATTTLNTIVDGVTNVTTNVVGNTTSATASGLLGGVGAGIAIGVDVAAQLLRNEKSITGKTAIEAVLNKDVKSSEELSHKIDIACKKNKPGGILLKEIAKSYTDENGVVNTEAMLKDLKAAGGTGSAVNTKEAYIFYAKSLKKPEPPIEEPPVVVEEPVVQEKRLEPLPVLTMEPVKLEVKKPEIPKLVLKPMQPVKIEPQESQVVVLVGETIEKLAKKYAVASDDIIEWNSDKVKEYNLPGGKKVKGFRVGEEIKLYGADLSDSKQISSTVANKQYGVFIQKCVEWGIKLTPGQATSDIINLINEKRAKTGQKPVATMEEAIKFAQEAN